MNDIQRDVYELREKLKERYGEKEVGFRPLVSVISPSLDALYFDTIITELKHGRLNKIDSGSFAGPDSYRLELDRVGLCITNPLTLPLAPSPRLGAPITTDNQGIEDYFHEKILSGVLEDNEHYLYGAWINGIPANLDLKYRGIPRGASFNQLEWCVNHFIEKGYGTNHCSIKIGSADSLKRYDWPYVNETDRGTSECLQNITLKIRDNKLDMSTFWRSWDLVAGLPENLGGMIKLLEYTTDMINAMKKSEQPEVKIGTLGAFSDGLHIYYDSLDVAKILANID